MISPPNGAPLSKSPLPQPAHAHAHPSQPPSLPPSCCLQTRARALHFVRTAFGRPRRRSDSKARPRLGSHPTERARSWHGRAGGRTHRQRASHVIATSLVSASFSTAAISAVPIAIVSADEATCGTLPPPAPVCPLPLPATATRLPPPPPARWHHSRPRHEPTARTVNGASHPEDVAPSPPARPSSVGLGPR